MEQHVKARDQIRDSDEDLPDDSTAATLRPCINEMSDTSKHDQPAEEHTGCDSGKYRDGDGQKASDDQQNPQGDRPSTRRRIGDRVHELSFLGRPGNWKIGGARARGLPMYHTV